jgi:outer membrane protein
MRKLPIVSLIPIFLLLFCAGTWAADAKQPAGPWSLEDCLRAAMQNQTDIIVAQNNVIAARSRVDQAKASYFPQLSIDNNAFVTGTGVLQKNTTGTAFSVSQNIFDGGIREANVKSASYGSTRNKAALTRTVQTVTFDITSKYYDVLRAKHLAEVAQASVKYNEELKAQVEASAEAGEAAKADVLPVEAQLATARVNLVSANNSVRTAALSLQSAMGITPQADFDVKDVQTVVEPKLLDLSDYLSAADTSRPDVLEAQASYGAARANTRAARIDLYPRPVISGQYQRTVSGGFTQSGGQIVGGLSFNLFDGGANRAAYREAKALQANADQQQRQVHRDIRVDVENAYLNLTSSRERLAASAVGLAAAKTNYENQTARYKEGVGITLDLLNAEVQLITAQANEVQARYDYYTAIAQLDYATGKGGSNAR